MKIINSGFIFLILLMLSACFGSGGGLKATAHINPAELVIDSPKSISPGETVFLDASRSYFDASSPNRNSALSITDTPARDPNRTIISWQWLQSSLDAHQITLLNADTAKAVFTAPDVVFGIVDLHFALTVVDDKGITAHKDVTVRLQGDTENAPVAVVKQIQDIVRVGDEIQLDGTASYFDDGDPLHDKFSNIVSYLWSQDAANPIRARIDNASRAIASVQVEKEFLGSQVLNFQLLVKDRHGRSGIKKFDVILKGDNQNPPVAEIKLSPNGVLRPKQEITLDGSKSFYDDGHPKHDKFANIVSRQWTQKVSDPDQVSLLPQSDSKVVSFTIADDFIGKKKLHFTLRVTDRHGRTATDEITVTVQGDSPDLPVAFIKGGNPQTASLNTVVELDGSLSFYDDGNPAHDKFKNIVSYKWEQKITDAVQLALTGSDKATASFTTPEDLLGNAIFNFTLTVVDKHQRTDEATIAVILQGREDKKPTAEATFSPLVPSQGDEVTLDGSASHDNGRGGKLVSWQWTQKATNDPQVTINTADKDKATFTLSESFLGIKKLHFTLLVTDQDGKTDEKSVEVSIIGNSETNKPVAKIKTTGLTNGKVGLGKEVTLDGADSFYDDDNSDTEDKDNIVSYLWVQDSDDELQVTLSNTDKKVATFTTVDELLGDSSLHFTLTVKDKHDRSDTASVTITIEGDSESNKPVAKIKTTGLTNGKVGLGKEVTLDGADSFYDDGNPETDDKDNIESYLWTQRETDALQVGLSGANTKLASFATPQDYLGTITLQFTLTVKDKNGREDDKTVFVTLEGRSDGKPTAVILLPGTFVAGQTLSLDGSQSSDNGEGGTIDTYLWELLDVPEGLVLALTSPNDPVASVKAPDVVIGNYLFKVKLTVTDNDGNTHSTILDMTLTGQDAYSISGKVTVPATFDMDSDVKNPSAFYKSNNTITDPQALNMPAKVVGYVDKITDNRDFYLFENMQAGDKIRVWHENKTDTDIHIYLYRGDAINTELPLVLDVADTDDAGDNKHTDRNITVPSSGDFILQVLAPIGATVYNMSVEGSSDPVSFKPWNIKLSLQDDGTEAIIKSSVLEADSQDSRKYPYVFTRVPVAEYRLSAFVDIDGDGEQGTYEPTGHLAVFNLVGDTEDRDFLLSFPLEPAEEDADGVSPP